VAFGTHALGYVFPDVLEVRPGDHSGYVRAEELARRTDRPWVGIRYSCA
jgi:hypothetical protein